MFSYLICVLGFLTCHGDRPNSEAHLILEREGDEIQLRSHHGGYLKAEEDRSFNANGHR